MDKGTENAFGRKSELRLTAGWDGKETFLRELGFTAVSYTHLYIKPYCFASIL